MNPVIFPSDVLFAAIRARSQCMIRFLLSNFALSNVSSDKAYTALCVACEVGDLETVEFLLAHDHSDPNAVNLRLTTHYGRKNDSFTDVSVFMPSTNAEQCHDTTIPAIYTEVLTKYPQIPPLMLSRIPPSAFAAITPPPTHHPLEISVLTNNVPLLNLLLAHGAKPSYCTGGLQGLLQLSMNCMGKSSPTVSPVRTHSRTPISNKALYNPHTNTHSPQAYASTKMPTTSSVFATEYYRHDKDDPVCFTSTSVTTTVFPSATTSSTCMVSTLSVANIQPMSATQGEGCDARPELLPSHSTLRNESIEPSDVHQRRSSNTTNGSDTDMSGAGIGTGVGHGHGHGHVSGGGEMSMSVCNNVFSVLALYATAHTTTCTDAHGHTTPSLHPDMASATRTHTTVHSDMGAHAHTHIDGDVNMRTQACVVDGVMLPHPHSDMHGHTHTPERTGRYTYMHADAHMDVYPNTHNVLKHDEDSVDFHALLVHACIKGYSTVVQSLLKCKVSPNGVNLSRYIAAVAGEGVRRKDGEGKDVGATVPGDAVERHVGDEGHVVQNERNGEGDECVLQSEGVQSGGVSGKHVTKAECVSGECVLKSGCATSCCFTGTHDTDTNVRHADEAAPSTQSDSHRHALRRGAPDGRMIGGFAANTAISGNDNCHGHLKHRLSPASHARAVILSTPLLAAIEANHADIVSMLLAYNVDVHSHMYFTPPASVVVAHAPSSSPSSSSSSSPSAAGTSLSPSCPPRSSSTCPSSPLSSSAPGALVLSPPCPLSTLKFALLKGHGTIITALLLAGAAVLPYLPPQCICAFPPSSSSSPRGDSSSSPSHCTCAASLAAVATWRGITSGRPDYSAFKHLLTHLCAPLVRYHQGDIMKYVSSSLTTRDYVYLCQDTDPDVGSPNELDAGHMGTRERAQEASEVNIDSHAGGLPVDDTARERASGAGRTNNKVLGTNLALLVLFTTHCVDLRVRKMKFLSLLKATLTLPPRLCLYVVKLLLYTPSSLTLMNTTSLHGATTLLPTSPSSSSCAPPIGGDDPHEWGQHSANTSCHTHHDNHIHTHTCVQNRDETHTTHQGHYHGDGDHEGNVGGVCANGVIADCVSGRDITTDTDVDNYDGDYGGNGGRGSAEDDNARAANNDAGHAEIHDYSHFPRHTNASCSLNTTQLWPFPFPVSDDNSDLFNPSLSADLDLSSLRIDTVASPALLARRTSSAVVPVHPSSRAHAASAHVPSPHTPPSRAPSSHTSPQNTPLQVHGAPSVASSSSSHNTYQHQQQQPLLHRGRAQPDTETTKLSPLPRLSPTSLASPHSCFVFSSTAFHASLPPLSPPPTPMPKSLSASTLALLALLLPHACLAYHIPLIAWLLEQGVDIMAVDVATLMLTPSSAMYKHTRVGTAVDANVNNSLPSSPTTTHPASTSAVSPSTPPPPLASTFPWLLAEEGRKAEAVLSMLSTHNYPWDTHELQCCLARRPRPLLLACYLGLYGIVQCLLSHRASPDALPLDSPAVYARYHPLWSHTTPLQAAAELLLPDVVSVLLRSQATLSGEMDLLHRACAEPIVEVRKTGDVKEEAESKDGNTSIGAGAGDADIDMGTSVAGRGPDVKANSAADEDGGHTGNTPSTTYTISAPPDYAYYERLYLRQYGHRDTAQVRLIELLLQYHFSPNAHNKDGNTALTIAVHNKQQVFPTLLLLQQGASADVPSLRGTFPIHDAANLLDSTKLAVLLAHHADVTARDVHGCSVFCKLWAGIPRQRRYDAYGTPVVTTTWMMLTDNDIHARDPPTNTIDVSTSSTPLEQCLSVLMYVIDTLKTPVEPLLLCGRSCIDQLFEHGTASPWRTIATFPTVARVFVQLLYAEPRMLEHVSGDAIVALVDNRAMNLDHTYSDGTSLYTLIMRDPRPQLVRWRARHLPPSLVALQGLHGPGSEDSEDEYDDRVYYV